jgi:inner membrane protein
MYPFWRRNTPEAWTFRQTTLFVFLLFLMHIWLDCVTSYGTLAFLPFSDFRVRLNGLFIIDFLLLVPLILACCIAHHRPRIVALAIVWLILYSGGAVAWRMNLQEKWNASLQADGIIPAQLNVLPDVFSPMFWKVQYKHDGKCYQTLLSWNGLQTRPWQQQQSADPTLLTRLAAEDRSARIWIGFSLLPLQDKQEWEGGKEYSFYDWRFNSLVPFIQNRRYDSAAYFSFKARIDSADKFVAVRYTSSMGDLGWLPPVAPKERKGIHWLLGLDY